MKEHCSDWFNYLQNSIGIKIGFTFQINNTEKVNVRCRIHHWATGLERLPWVEYHWKKPLEPLIPEQASILEQMPLPN